MIFDVFGCRIIFRVASKRDMVGFLVDSNIIDSKIVWPGEVIKVDSLEVIRHTYEDS